MSFLRQLFGPSREETWRELASQIGADFHEGGWWNHGKVVARVGAWEVTLDVFVVSTGKSHTSYTRLRAPFVNKDNFRFAVYRKNIFSSMGKFFGMQDIEVGHPGFDEAFIVKSNDEFRVKQLLNSARLRELMEAQPSLYLMVCDDEGWFGAKFPEGVDELRFQVAGVIKEIERLKGLFDLFAETLDRLCQIGSAYETDPGIKL